MQLPSVSVCIPTRNRAGSLRQTIESMQSQIRPYTELIVGDDASEDDTKVVVESFRDPRIRYLRHERNIGIYANWNELIRAASGDYVAIYHDHDEYFDTIIQRSAQLLDQHEDMTFAHTAIKLVDVSGGLLGIDVRSFPSVMPGSDLRCALANSWYSPVMAATAMVRRSAYLKFGPYEDAEFGLGCDKHMWFRLAQEGSVGYVEVPQVNIRAREKGGATSVFAWRHVHGELRMRQCEIAEFYANDPARRAHALERMNREKDRRLLTFSLRSLLLDDPAVWAGEEKRVLDSMGFGPRLLYCAAKGFPPLRNFLRSVALPLHYRRVERQALAEQERAKKYVSGGLEGAAARRHREAV